MIVVRKGGPESGFHGHAGIPGHQGGSSRTSGVYLNYFDNLQSRFQSPCQLEFIDKFSEEGYSSAKGVYSPDENKIYLSNKYLASNVADDGNMPSGDLRNLAQLGWKFLIAHEYGHAYDAAHSSPSLGDKWSGIVERYNNAHKFDPYTGKFGDETTLLSQYSISIGYSKYIESFAEAFAAYTLRADWLKSNNPDMFSFISELETGVTKELSEDQNPYDTNMVEVFDGEDFEWIDNPNQSSQTSPGMTSRDSQGLQAERNGRKRPKFRVVKKLPTIPDIQEEEFLPASLVKQ